MSKIRNKAASTRRPEMVTHWPTVIMVAVIVLVCLSIQMINVEKSTDSQSIAERDEIHLLSPSYIFPLVRKLNYNIELPDQIDESESYLVVQRSVAVWISDMEFPPVVLQFPSFEELQMASINHYAINEYADAFDSRRTNQPHWRRDFMSEVELREILANVPTVDFHAIDGAADELIKAEKLNRNAQLAKTDKKDEEQKEFPEGTSLVNLIASREDLQGLPFLKGEQCRIDKKAARFIQHISLEFRKIKGLANRKIHQNSFLRSHNKELNLQSRTEKVLLTPKQRQEYIDYLIAPEIEHECNWQFSNFIPGLVQMLQPEGVGIRRSLVRVLNEIEGKRATHALAERAVFELSPEVREEAIAALKKRPLIESRNILLKRLRYPWSPAADHAAEALVVLSDVDAIPALKELLEKSDPRAPFQEENGRWVVNEMVRMNHMRNCLLCHAISSSPGDRLRGIVPTPGRPMPSGYSRRIVRSCFFVRRPRIERFIRADITYLRQDFSVSQHDPTVKPWPDWQRFDFLVRRRALTDDELAAWQSTNLASHKNAYPQRYAVDFALRKLKQAAAEKHENLNKL